MPIAMDSHPDISALSSFSLGRLSDVESAAIEVHLADCESCRILLEAAPADSLVAMLRNSNVTTPQPQLPRPAQSERFEILNEIGRGGMGVVYRARQVGLNRLVALKMLRDGTPYRAEDAVRFKSEAEAAARLQHPNIAQIYEIGEFEGKPFLAFEYISGSNLSDRLQGKPMPPMVAAALVEILADALDFAHRQGVVHRDLKPANILLQKNRDDGDELKLDQHSTRKSSFQWGSAVEANPLSTAIPKIADFGLAKLMDDPDGPTRTGALLGTPSYMSPEQTAGEPSKVGPPTDIYALGAILYECLTGRPPFRAATALETLEQVRTDEPVPVRTLQPRTPIDLETICLKCLRKEPLQRYSRGSDLADDLRRFQRGETIVGRPISSIERLGKWIRRQPAQAALLGLAILVAGAAVIGITIHNSRLRVEVDRADREQQRASEHYRQARSALRQVLSHGAPDVVAPKSRITDVRLRQIEDAIAFYQDAANSDEKDPEVRHDLAVAHLAAASELTAQSRLDRAEPHMIEGRRLLEELHNNDPQNRDYRQMLGACYNNLGFLYVSQEKPIESMDNHLKSLSMRESLFDPEEPKTWRPLAEASLNVGTGYHFSHRFNEAEKFYRRAEELWAKVHAKEPSPYSALNLGDCKINVVLLTAQPDHIDEANSRYVEIKTLMGPLVNDPQVGVNCATSLAGAYVNWANLLRAAHQGELVFDKFERAQNLLDMVKEQSPTWFNAQQIRYNLHGARAQAFDSQGRHQDALRDWDFAVAVAPNPGRRRWVQITRLFTRTKLGDYQTTIKELRELEKESRLDGTAHYNFACVYSLCIPIMKSDSSLDASQRERNAEDYAVQAIQHLKAAHSAGFFKDPNNQQNLKQDSDLNALRTLSDFQLLLQLVTKPPT